MGLALSCAEVSAGAVISTSVGAAIINGTSRPAVISGGAIGIVVIFGGAMHKRLCGDLQLRYRRRCDRQWTDIIGVVAINDLASVRWYSG